MFNMVLGMNWTSGVSLKILFEYPPCSDLFHIGHCIIPRSQGCVWLVGWDVHLQVGHEMEVSNIGRRGLGPREHYGWNNLYFSTVHGFQKVFSHTPVTLFPFTFDWIEKKTFMKSENILQTITLWSVRWPQWPKSKSIRQRHQIGQNKPLFIDVKE